LKPADNAMLALEAVSAKVSCPCDIFCRDATIAGPLCPIVLARALVPFKTVSASAALDRAV
jgi:hypothetical protein